MENDITENVTKSVLSENLNKSLKIAKISNF